MIIRVLTEHRRSMDEYTGNFKIGTEYTYVKSRVKNTINEVKKNIPEGINSRLDDADEWIMADKVVEVTPLKEQFLKNF